MKQADKNIFDMSKDQDDFRLLLGNGGGVRSQLRVAVFVEERRH